MGTEWMQWYGPPAAMTLVSFVYLVTDRGRPYPARLLTSAHGIAGVVLYFAAFVVAWADPRGFRPHLAVPYMLLYLIPVGLIALALRRFTGSRWVHTLQGLNVVAMLWALFVGSMAITGDWL